MIIGAARLIGIAYPIPSMEVSASFAELIPISSPFIFNKAPPLFPGLIAASVCTNPFSEPDLPIWRFVALTIPLLKVYNGGRGTWKGMKYLFYIYYPLHLVICGIIRIVLHGNISVMIGG